MREIIAGFLILGIYGGVAFTAELQNRMEFPAKNGTVTFYHGNHANEVQGNCKICHEGTPGKIPGFGKEYAHKFCVGCHEPRDGRPEGPTNCEGCHVK